MPQDRALGYGAAVGMGPIGLDAKGECSETVTRHGHATAIAEPPQTREPEMNTERSRTDTRRVHIALTISALNDYFGAGWPTIEPFLGG